MVLCLDIYTVIEEAMAAHQCKENPGLEQILDAEKEAWEFVDRWIEAH